MSLTFTLADVSLPGPASLRAAAPGGVHVDTEVSDRGLPPDSIARLVTPRRSTRGAIVRWSALEGLSVQVASLGAVEDVRVAVRAACTLADELGVPIDDGRRVAPPAEIRSAWSKERRNALVRQDERAMRDIARQSRLRISGVQRAVVLGPALMRRVPDTPGALVRWLRHTQWLPGQPPLPCAAERVGGDPQAPLLATLEPGARALVAPSELVRLPGEPEIIVPRDVLVEALGSQAAMLDEEQVLVEAMVGDAWRALRARVANRAVKDPVVWSRRAPREVVLPVLRTPEWSGRTEALCLPLHAGRPQGLPLVTLVRQRGPSSSLVARAELGPAEQEELLAHAVSVMEERLPPWDLDREPDGRVTAAVLSGPLAAEALLSTARLREAHELLGTPVLVAAAPVRGVLRLERGDDPQHADPAGLLTWATTIWKQATGEVAATALTPDLLIVVDGQVQGSASAEEGVESPSDDGSLEMPGLADLAETDEVSRTPDPTDPKAGFRGDHRAILALAVPALGSLAAEPLVSLADTAMVSTLGDAAVGALGVSAGVLSLAFVIFNFLAYGTTPLVSEARARGDREGAGRVVVAALFLAGWIGILGGGVLAVLAPWCVSAMGASGELVEPSTTYLAIRAMGAPALLLIIAGHGAYRGFHDTATPLVVSLMVAGVNLVLDAVLIFGLGLGIEGAAWASVGAQWLGAGMFLALLLGPSGRQRGVIRAFPRYADLTRLLGVGSILSVRTLAVVGTMTLAAAVATRLGTVEVAAHQVVAQVWMLAALLVDGLAVAGQALISGAPTHREGRQVTLRLLRWGLGAGLALAALILLVRPLLPYLFQVSPETLDLASTALLVAAAIQPISALVFVGDGLYLGARRFTFAAISMVVSAAVGAVLLLTLPQWLGFIGVWVALALFLTARAAVLVLGALPASTRAAAASGAGADP